MGQELGREGTLPVLSYRAESQSRLRSCGEEGAHGPGCVCPDRNRGRKLSAAGAEPVPRASPPAGRGALQGLPPGKAAASRALRASPPEEPAGGRAAGLSEPPLPRAAADAFLPSGAAGGGGHDRKA